MKDDEIYIKPDKPCKAVIPAGGCRKIWINRKLLTKRNPRNPVVVAMGSGQGIVVSRIMDENGKEVARLVMDSQRTKVWLETDLRVDLELL